MTLAVLMNLGFAGSASADTEPPTAQPVFVEVLSANARTRLLLTPSAARAKIEKSQNSVETS